MEYRARYCQNSDLTRTITSKMVATRADMKVDRRIIRIIRMVVGTGVTRTKKIQNITMEWHHSSILMGDEKTDASEIKFKLS